MIKKFAVDPRAVCRWEDFRYVMEKLGFAQGRVLARYPKKWPRALLDELKKREDLTEIEYTRFVEKLRRYQEDRMISLGEPYEPSRPWSQNAVSLPVGKVDSIILAQHEQKFTVSQNIQAITDLDEDFFSASREVRCSSTVEHLCQAAHILLAETSVAYFIDPYFRIALDSCAKVLAGFVERSVMTGRCRQFVVYTKEEFRPRANPSTALEHFRARIATNVSGLQIDFHFVDNSDSTNRLHARYLLTQKGGLRYDKGFEAPLNPPLVDISLLDHALHRELFEFYHTGAEKLIVRDSWSWVL